MDFLNAQFFSIEISKYLAYHDLRNLKLALPGLFLDKNLYLNKKKAYKNLLFKCIDECDAIYYHIYFKLPQLVLSLYMRESGIVNDVLTITENNKTVIYVIYDRNFFDRFFIGHFRSIVFSNDQQQIEFIAYKAKRSNFLSTMVMFSLFALLIAMIIFRMTN